MKKIVLIFPLLTTLPSAQGQHFTATVRSLCDTTKTSALFQSLADARKIPLVENDSVAFLYKGEANAVAWVGDFNGWGYDAGFPNKGKKIPHTNIWLLKTAFPKNARLDYKIVLNGDTYILDPENRTSSGVV